MLVRLVDIRDLGDFEKLDKPEVEQALSYLLLLGVNLYKVKGGIKFGSKVFHYPFTNLEMWEYIDDEVSSKKVDSHNVIA
jgi:hypothetical protein